MPLQVVSNAQLACTFGLSPANFMVLPLNRTTSSSQYAANIQDFQPMVNILPFGMCQSPTNPQVAAATTAAMGVLTPQPCLPNTTMPWVPGASKTMIAGQPALDSACTCTCLWGGVITITSPGQTTELIA